MHRSPDLIVALLWASVAEFSVWRETKFLTAGILEHSSASQRFDLTTSGCYFCRRITAYQQTANLSISKFIFSEVIQDGFLGVH
jgi:hypothetical protein